MDVFGVDICLICLAVSSVAAGWFVGSCYKFDRSLAFFLGAINLAPVFVNGYQINQRLQDTVITQDTEVEEQQPERKKDGNQ